MIRRSRTCEGSSGFTLVEVAIALVVLGILTGLAAPSLSGVFRDSRSRGAAAQFASDVSHARMLAIRSGRGGSLSFTGAASYQVREGNGASAVTRKTVDLATDYGAAVEVVRVSAGESLVFDSRGMLVAGAGKLAIRSQRAGYGVPADTIRISPIGLVRRDR
jgi:prepilin-type N-terminal cleavage/methylation domain-containing protein